MPRRFVVLGMHKSGTSLIARTLHESGVHMSAADGTLTYDQGNKFERSEARSINKAILGVGRSASFRRIKERNGSPSKRDALREDALRLVGELNEAHSEWGFKDPRTSLTYPFWQDLLGEHGLILVFRDPAEVWHHYVKAVGAVKKNLKTCMRTVPVLRTWYQYNSQALQHVRESACPTITLEYGAFMQEDAGMRALETFVGRRLSDVRDPALYRNRRAPGRLLRMGRGLVQRIWGEDVNGLWAALMRQATTGISVMPHGARRLR